MTIRKPPSKLARPNLHRLAEGTVLERVHSLTYAGNAFNPGLGGPTRFAPIEDANGTTIPTLYGANTLEAAFHEVIFHDVPSRARKKRVSKTLIMLYAHSQLQVMRDLQLASLREVDLMKWRIKRNDLITTTPKLCKNTAGWATAIHHQFPDIEGLVWTSNQCDRDTAYLFFGDRVSNVDFRILCVRDGQTDKTVLSDVCKAGKLSGIKITV